MERKWAYEKCFINLEHPALKPGLLTKLKWFEKVKTVKAIFLKRMTFVLKVVEKYKIQL